MLTKFYQMVGLALCIGLGTAFAFGWKAPNLGFFDGTSSGGTGRSGFFYSGGGGGFHFGK
ncbi:MAG: hypothetical protein HQ518_20745 [Rhodopirellula sp.]|nr:hypothetical protein [Rhodopirellula sp.]